jgi:tagatose-1,6-bisphosphate aldolase non-catalytic subunit AgaZ/GatZ
VTNILNGRYKNSESINEFIENVIKELKLWIYEAWPTNYNYKEKYNLEIERDKFVIIKELE